MEVQPQTDREWMMMLSQDVKMLSNSINKFAEKIEIFEERKLVDFDKRMKNIEQWKAQWDGVRLN